MLLESVLVFIVFIRTVCSVYFTGQLFLKYQVFALYTGHLLMHYAIMLVICIVLYAVQLLI